MKLRLSADPQTGQAHRPHSNAYQLEVEAGQPSEFTLRLRLPWWLSAPAEATLNGERVAVEAQDGYLKLRRTWSQDSLHLVFPKELTAVPLPDEPEMCAFMDGPVVLAGLNPGGGMGTAATKALGSYTARPNYRIDGIPILGDASRPESFLSADNEREWGYWRGDYRTRGQPQNFRLIPLHEVRDEAFTIYFPVKKD